MSQTITRNQNGTLKIERDGERYTGVSTGIPSNSPTLRKLAGRKRSPATIVGSTLSQWPLKGFVEHDGTVYVYGPELSVEPLDLVLEDSDRNRLEALSSVAASYATLLENEHLTTVTHTRTIFLLPDGRVLFMAPDIMESIREHQNYAERIRTMERFRHPDRSAEANIGFFLASAAYYVMTGEYAYDGEDEEILHAKVRSSTTVPAQARNIEVESSISSQIHEALTSDSQTATPREWAHRLADWALNGYTEDIDPPEAERRKKLAIESMERAEKGFRRREGIRRHGRTAVIIAAIVIIAGAIPFTIIRNALAPRQTAGFSAEEVVTAFYTSFNSLDHDLMEDAVIDDAGAPYIREVVNLFVIDRQRMGVEGQSGFVDAAQWREAGMPTLDSTRSPYGVYDLQIEPISAPADERWFELTYERWYPSYEQEQAGSRFTAVRQREEVRLRLDDEDWVIYEFEILESDQIGPAEIREMAASAES